MKVDILDLDSFVACFWQVKAEKWEGVINKVIENGEVSVIKSDKAIILFRKSDFVQPVAVSSENNPLPL